MIGCRAQQTCTECAEQTVEAGRNGKDGTRPEGWQARADGEWSNPPPGVDAHPGCRWRGSFRSSREESGVDSPQVPGKGTRTAAFETLVHCEVETRPRVGIANDPGQGHEGFKLWDNRPRDSRPSVGSAKVSRSETGSARPWRVAGKANDPQPKGE